MIKTETYLQIKGYQPRPFTLYCHKCDSVCVGFVCLPVLEATPLQWFCEYYVIFSEVFWQRNLTQLYPYSSIFIFSYSPAKPPTVRSENNYTVTCTVLQLLHSLHSPLCSRIQGKDFNISLKLICNILTDHQN